MSILNSEITSPEAATGWNDFVMRCEPGHFQQTSWWARVEGEDGWESKCLLLRRDGAIVAGARVNLRNVGRWGRVGYVDHGPLVAQEADDANAEVSQALARALCEMARKERLLLLVVSLSYSGQVLGRRLRASGFTVHPWLLPPSRLPQRTLVVDVDRELTEIEKGLRRTTRKQIRRSHRRGFQVREGKQVDLPLFWELLNTLCHRRGVTPNVPSLAYVQRAWMELRPQQMTRLFIGEVDDAAVSALLCFTCKDWFFAWRIGWSGEHAEAYPTKGLFWHAIQCAAREGFRHFDFMGIEADEQQAMSTGEVPSPDAGIAFFKLGFGGSILELPPALDYSSQPIIRWGLRCGFQRILASKIGALAARRLLQGQSRLPNTTR